MLTAVSLSPKLARSMLSDKLLLLQARKIIECYHDGSERQSVLRSRLSLDRSSNDGGMKYWRIFLILATDSSSDSLYPLEVGR